MTRLSPFACLALLLSLVDCGRAQPGGAGGVAWSPIEAAVAPEARHDASMVLARGTDRLYLFGGRTAEGCRSDLWRFTPGRDRWERVEAADGPSARSGAGLAWDQAGERLILFGGYCQDGLGQTHFFGDLWFYTRAEGWTREFVSGGPGPRAWHAMGVDRGRLIVFGGSAPAPGYYREDVWELDLKRLHWRRPASDGGPLMPGRPILLADPTGPGRLIAFGRHGIPVPTSVGIWRLELEKDRWSPPDPRSDRREHPPTGFQLAGATASGWLFSAVGPGDVRTGWDIWSTHLGSGSGWLHSGDLPGPATPYGVACAEEPGRAAGWICFGGVWRDRLSSRTWRLSLRPTAQGLEPHP